MDRPRCCRWGVGWYKEGPQKLDTIWKKKFPHFDWPGWVWNFGISEGNLWKSFAWGTKFFFTALVDCPSKKKAIGIILPSSSFFYPMRLLKVTYLGHASCCFFSMHDFFSVFFFPHKWKKSFCPFVQKKKRGIVSLGKLNFPLYKIFWYVCFELLVVGEIFWLEELW